MKTGKDRSTPCVIRQSAIDNPRRKGTVTDSSSEPEDCRVIESVKKLMALGLSSAEIEQLDVRQPMLQSICEFARLDDEPDAPGLCSADAADETLRLVEDQIHDLDIEIEMLSMRRQALKRRTKALQKLAGSLRAYEDSPLDD